jgi:hypothetical protein
MCRNTKIPEWAKLMLWLLVESNYRLETLIMSEAQDAVDAVVAQLGKAKDEILTEVANLEAQVAAGQAPDLTALKAAAQSLDDINPDPVVEPPVEPPVEEPTA